MSRTGMIKEAPKDLSERVVSRLTKYLNILKECRKYEENINSKELAIKMESTAAQVRKDLSTFGEFGVRGKGYSVNHLISIIENILGISDDTNVILVGYGNMGNMLVVNRSILGKGFNIVGIFDKDDAKIGEINNNLEVKSIKEMKNFIKSNNIEMAILAVNTENAQITANNLIKYGIKAILNMTAFKLELYTDIAIVDVDVSAKLQELNFWRIYKKNMEGRD